MATVQAEVPQSIPKTPRPSKVSKWRALVLILVHVAIIIHVLHWRSAGETLGPIEPSEGITFSQNSVISAGLVFFVIATLSTLVVGRFFCGWGCHLLALQDSCLWLLKKIGIKPKPMRSRILLIIPLLAFVYMFLYPFLYRVWFGMPIPAPTTEFIVEDFWATFPPWPIAVATLLTAGFAIVYFLGAKGFCTNLCPYGAAFGIADRISPARIRVTDDCEGCGHCTQVCTSNVVVHAEVRDYGMVVDQECMKCMDCVSVCPKNALYFGFGKPAILAKPERSKKVKAASSWWKVNRWHSYSWTEEVIIGVLFVAAFFTFRGLYNTIPFLFALAIAALLTYGAMQALRLFYKPKVSLQGFELKSSEGITASGKLYGVFSILALAFWAQSAFVHMHRAQGEQGYLELNPLVTSSLRNPGVLTPDQQSLAEQSLEHVRIAKSWTPLWMFPREEWELNLTSGWLKLLLGDAEGFIADLEVAADVFPDNFTAADGLANYYVAIGNVEEADRWFERSTVAAPETMVTWANWSNFLISTGRFDEAQAILEEAAGHEEIKAPALVMVGQIEVGRSNMEGAETLFRAAVEHDPELLDAHLSLAGVLRDREKYAESAASYEHAIEKGADSFEIRLATTLSYNLGGQLDDAERHARAAMQMAPHRPEPWYALRQIALDRGDEAEAMRCQREAELRTSVVPN